MTLKTSDLRNLTREELELRLTSLKTELFNLRFQSTAGRVEKPHKVKETRGDIARIMTILKEKEVAEKNAGK